MNSESCETDECVSSYTTNALNINDYSDWRYPMRRDMQEIIPGLYLGPFSSATKAKLQTLLEAGITHILCVRHELEASFIQPNFPEKFVYSVLNLADASTTNIIQLLPQVKQFIDSCLKIGGKVLVHSNAGVSRSPALVIGYIMETKKMPYRDAFSLVQIKRHCICPNEGFMHQLKEYEPIYKAKINFHVNGHTSKATGKFKRKIDQDDMSETINNSMDVCEDSDL